MDSRMPWHQTHSQPLSQPSQSIESSMDEIDVNDHGQESNNNEVSGSSRRNVKSKSLCPSRISHKKQKKMSPYERIARSLERMSDIIVKKSISSRGSSGGARQYSIRECMEILYGMSGVEEGGKLWMYATRCFLKSAVREMFLTIKKDETRLKWLQFQYEWDMQRRSSLVPSVHASTGESHHTDNASSG